jgi:hypothetical protein
MPGQSIGIIIGELEPEPNEELRRLRMLSG